jgi:hypothetical protein
MFFAIVLLLAPLLTSAFYGSGRIASMGVRVRRKALLQMQAADLDPLLLRTARGEKVERVPVWMMRQAGRHMTQYRELCKKHKTFRERSEIAEVATEIR